MRHTPLRTVALVLIALVSLLPRRTYAQQPQRPDMGSSLQLMNIARATYEYNDKNGHLPPDLASLLPYIDNKSGSADAIRNAFLAPGLPSPAIPDKIQPAWINDNASYIYLGSADVRHDEIPLWGEVAIAHLKLDQGYRFEANPDVPLITMTFADTHSEVMDLPSAIRVIDQSKQVYEAIRTGAALPDRMDVVFSFAQIHKAIVAYAAANDGKLPPDLGSTLPYVKQTKRLNTPAQRASIFLSPRVKKNLHIPEEPTPEWVNRNTSFVYLGSADIKLASVEDRRHTVVLHVKPEDSTSPLSPDAQPQDLYPVLAFSGEIERAHKAYYDWIIPYSKKVLEYSKTGAPLPDLAHALRDLRLIHAAFKDYAKANNGQLAPNLGSLLPYLPEKEFVNATAQERARVFLPPRAERITQPPENADAAWVNAQSTYAYVVNPAATFAAVTQRSGLFIAHVPLDEEIKVMSTYQPKGMETVIPAVETFGEVFPYPSGDWFANALKESNDLYREAAQQTQQNAKEKAPRK